MKTATTIVHMTLRVSGLLLILLGLAIWTGRADPVIPVHMFLGFVLVLSLWTLAFFAARAGVASGTHDLGLGGRVFRGRHGRDGKAHP